MSNNKIDHEAAKRYAAYIGDMARDHVCDQDDVNLSACYLDAMAQRDEATELLERAYWLVEHFETATYDTKSDWGRLVRAFLAKHRKHK